MAKARVQTVGCHARAQRLFDDLPRRLDPGQGSRRQFDETTVGDLTDCLDEKGPLRIKDKRLHCDSWR
jgi:hypothetical protein